MIEVRPAAVVVARRPVGSVAVLRHLRRSPVGNACPIANPPSPPARTRPTPAAARALRPRERRRARRRRRRPARGGWSSSAETTPCSAMSAVSSVGGAAGVPSSSGRVGVASPSAGSQRDPLVGMSSSLTALLEIEWSTTVTAPAGEQPGKACTSAVGATGAAPAGVRTAVSQARGRPGTVGTWTTTHSSALDAPPRRCSRSGAQATAVNPSRSSTGPPTAAGGTSTSARRTPGTTTCRMEPRTLTRASTHHSAPA